MVLCSVPEKRRRVQQSLRPNLNHNFKSFGTGESFYLSNSPYTIAPAGLDQATRRVEQPFLSDAETIYQTMKPLALPEDRLASPTNRRGSSDLLGQPEADQSQQAIRFWLRSAASRTKPSLLCSNRQQTVEARFFSPRPARLWWRSVCERTGRSNRTVFHGALKRTVTLGL